MRSFMIWLPVLLVTGCASLSPEQCRHADWRQIGFADGASGSSAARINDHAKACAEVGVLPNLDGYLSGREQGLQNYCRSENGFAVGRSGSVANIADCPEHMKTSFLDQYRHGQQVYMVEQDLARRRSRIYQNNSHIRRNNERIADIREELARKDLPDERRTVLLNDFNRLVEQKNALGRENAFLIAESDRATFHLQMQLRELGRWR